MKRGSFYPNPTIEWHGHPVLGKQALVDPDELSGLDLGFRATVSDDLLRGTKDPLLLLSPKLRTA